MNEQNNPILEVKNLRVSYHTYAGEVRQSAVYSFLSRKVRRSQLWANPAAENL